MPLYFVPGPTSNPNSQSHYNSPFGPLTPRSPGGPLSPGSPLTPACPGKPLSPGGPGGPGGPGLPGSPTAPDSGLLRLAANWASCPEMAKTKCTNECEWSPAISKAYFYLIYPLILQLHSLIRVI